MQARQFSLGLDSGMCHTDKDVLPHRGNIAEASNYNPTI